MFLKGGKQGKEKPFILKCPFSYSLDLPSLAELRRSAESSRQTVLGGSDAYFLCAHCGSICQHRSDVTKEEPQYMTGKHRHLTHPKVSQM